MSKPVVNDYAEQCKLLDASKSLRCYRNLRTGLFSVQQNGIVKFHTNRLFLRDVEFIVGEKGRQRVLAERQKNVHSFVQGLICDQMTCIRIATDKWFTHSYVRYNPYEGPYFTTLEGASVKSAIVCMLTKEGEKLRVFAKGVRLYESEPNDLDTVVDCDTICESVFLHLL